MIGFIGTGHMASAIITGLLDDMEPSQIVASASTIDSARAAAERFGITPVENNTAVVEKVGSGTIILAVKPAQILEVADEIAPMLESDTLVISIAAGIQLETLAEHLPKGQPLARVMPNVNAAVGQSMSALAFTETVTEEQKETATSIFSAIGQAAVVAEKDFAAFSALAGCSPAFFCEIIEAFAKAGVKNGLKKEAAVRYATQAMLGTAQLILDQEAGISPANVRDTVCSPGGTTIAGVVAMEQAGLGAAIQTGVQASIDRDRELG